MNIRAVIFDLDGTLIVHKLKLREAKEEFLRNLRERLNNVVEFSPDSPIASILEEMSGEERMAAFKIMS
ncbi:MAG: hypothetical protein QXW31_05455, partial [Nitrososphaerota archaeon]